MQEYGKIQLSPVDQYATQYFALLMSEREDKSGRGVVFTMLCCCCCIGAIVFGLVAGLSAKHHHHHHHHDHHDHHHHPHPTPSPQPTPFCCVQDEFVFPGSPWASAGPTLCGDYDYNCDGTIDEWACCSREVVAIGDRILYKIADDCQETGPISQLPDAICGACVDGITVVPGWQCSPDVDDDRKRNMPICPIGCEQGPAIVTPTIEPSIGQCALYVTSCIPPNGGDGSVCCQVAAA